MFILVSRKVYFLVSSLKKKFAFLSSTEIIIPFPVKLGLFKKVSRPSSLSHLFLILINIYSNSIKISEIQV